MDGRFHFNAGEKLLWEFTFWAVWYIDQKQKHGTNARASIAFALNVNTLF